jgi:prevent-host-death family protein
MSEVGAYEAKAHFAQLLNRVMAGEKITITRHGVPVAVLAPVTASDREKIREAVEGIKALGKKHSLGGLSIRELIEEGRM